MIASSIAWPELLALVTLAALLIGSRFLPAARMSVEIQLERRRRHRAADIALPAMYHRQLPSEAKAESLDDRTCHDLDLEELFRSLDFTASQLGRQYLYHMLRTPQRQTEPLEHLERAGRELTSSPDVLETLRSHLGRLDDPRAGQLAHLVLGELPKRPPFWWAFPILTAGALTCLALIPFWPRALVAWLVIAVVNVCVQLFYKPRVKRFVPAFHELPRLLSVAGVLGTLTLPELEPEITRLQTGARNLGALRRATSWLMFEPDEASEFVSSLYEYVNLLFLLDVNAFVFAIERMRACQAQVRMLFETIGYLDVLQSIAAWRATLPVWCTPHFTEARKYLSVDGVVHPLVSEAVANALDVDGTSVLITGSNMSGKSTFIRALGVNAILAQSLHTACATRWCGPMLHVRTSIARSDSVTDGRSYYLAELESVGALVHAKSNDRQHLFLLDEIFRGTNTTERVAAGAAVLSYLTAGEDLVVVATHDLEVIDLVGGDYESYHFREHVEHEALVFDYRMRRGASSTRNAIALLAAMRFPAQLVADAKMKADWATRPGIRHSAI